MEEEYERLIKEMRNAYFLVQNERVVLVSDHMAEYFGYSKGELTGMHFAELVVAEECQRSTELYRRVLAGQQIPRLFKTIAVNKNGIHLPVEFSIWLTQYRGQPAVAGILTYATERHKADEVSLWSEPKYGTAKGYISGKVFFKDINLVYVFCNESYAQYLGIKPEEISGKTDYEFYPRELATNYRENDQRAIESGEMECFEERYIQHEEERLIQTYRIPVKDMEGNAIGILGISNDITRRKKRDQALQDSADNVRLMFEHSPYGVTILDPNTVITEVNDRILEMYGTLSKGEPLTRGELIGKTGSEVVAPHQRERITQYLRRCLNEGLVVETGYSTIRADGSMVSFMTSVDRLIDIDGNVAGLIATSKDVTYEKRLKENERLYIAERIKADEDARRQLARALHDDTIQELLMATHRLHDVIAGSHGRLPKDAQGHLEETRVLMENMVADLRRFTTDLRPDVLDDMGLIPALRWLTNGLRDGNGVKARLNVLGEQRRLPSGIELTIFRIAQEALNNIRKHANATTALVKLEFRRKDIILSIIDNGNGFELPDEISHFARQRKLGLIGIVERVRLHNGGYKVESSPGKGASITVEISH